MERLCNTLDTKSRQGSNPQLLLAIAVGNVSDNWLIRKQRGSGMTNGTSSTVRRRELGQRLRELRQARALTLEQVAAELMCPLRSSAASRVAPGAPASVTFAISAPSTRSPPVSETV